MENNFNKSYAALLYDEIEEYHEVIAQLTEYLNNNDINNYHALNNRAVANLEIGNIEIAINDLKKAISLNPNSYVPYHVLARVYENSNEIQKAWDLYDTAIDLFPNEYSCYCSRAYFYFEQKDWVNAILDFNRLIELNPNNKDLYISRSRAKEKNGDVEGAKEDWAIVKKL